MKSIKFFVVTMLLISINFGCGNSCDEGDVTNAANKITTAAEEYGSDPTNKTKCNAYKDALQNWIDAVDGCDEVTKEQREIFQSAFDDLDCK